MEENEEWSLKFCRRERGRRLKMNEWRIREVNLTIMKGETHRINEERLGNGGGKNVQLSSLLSNQVSSQQSSPWTTSAAHSPENLLLN